jgi:beta-glucosidase
LADKGIENIIMSDGPAGLNIINEITIDDSGREFPVKVPQRWNIGAMGEMAKKMINTKATPYYRYATAWPVHLVLAQTWNEKLLTKIGNEVGQEMIDFGVTLWLAPGMNIQRNPLCGRNFEYFSEDPLLSGKMAAAITKGVQQFDGIGVTLKHFACNNQEDNRTSVSSNINERALREIYLKGFEIAIKEAEPKAVMTSYNKINHMFTANSHDLCTKLLRCEWGFAGLVMTDWGGKSDPGLCAVAGNDLVMPGTDSDKEAIAKALENGTIKPDMLRRAAARVLECIVNSDIYANKQ